MRIDHLIEVLKPPSIPIESGIGQNWGKITNLLCNPLPSDFMCFIDYYGSGIIGDWLQVFNPFSTNQQINFIEQFISSLSLLSSLKREYSNVIPYPLLFETGGLLPWGNNINGDIYCYLTNGLAYQWKIVIILRDGECEEYELSFSEFIIKSIKGEINSNAIPVEWKNGIVLFESYNQ